MALNKDHPRYAYLQGRLDALRGRVAAKRDEAKQVFESVLHELALRPSAALPELLKDQLEEIRNALKLGTPGQERQTEFATQRTAELTIEDIFKAMQFLTVSEGVKTKLSIKQMEEELKKVVATRHMMSRLNMPTHWQCHVVADDVTTLLGAKFPELCAKAGSAALAMDNVVEMAERISNQALNKLSVLKHSYSEVASPLSTPKSPALLLHDSFKR